MNNQTKFNTNPKSIKSKQYPPKNKTQNLNNLFIKIK